jgi:hypothetical protein
MPHVPDGCKLVLDPNDDFNHVPDAVSNYNESMYFSVLDLERAMGGWVRIGNRVHEGYAEMTNCWYLPDGRVAFMAGRPKIASNREMNAGGLRFEILAPFERHRVAYEGKMCLLERPHEMADPGRAFRENPIVECRLEVDLRAATQCVGGEVVREDGTPLPIDPERGFGKAHFDQFMQGGGWLEVGEQRFEFAGHGARDKSWGARYWQSIDWYRWIHCYVSPELSIAATVLGDRDQERCTGLAFTPGGVEEIAEGRIETEWDERGHQRRLRFETRAAGVDYEIVGRVVSLIPLRNRRQRPDGTWLHTRITEGLTRYSCNGVAAIGMSEYLDQIVDGRPARTAN